MDNIVYDSIFFLYNPGPQILGPGPTRARNYYLGPQRAQPGPGIPCLGPGRAQARNSCFGPNLGLYGLDLSSKFLFLTWCSLCKKQVVSMSPTHFPNFILCGLRSDRKTNKQTSCQKTNEKIETSEKIYRLFPVRPKL